MRIKVLGTGCARFKKLVVNVRQAADQSGAAYDLNVSTDIIEILSLGIATPALFINGTLVSYGCLPTVEELERLISQSQHLS